MGIGKLLRSAMLAATVLSAATMASWEVFNCDADDVQTAKLSLFGAGKCTDPILDYGRPMENLKIQVLREVTVQEFNGIRCDVRRSVTAKPCGYIERHNADVSVEVDQPVDVGPEECRKAYQKGRFRVDGHRIRVNPDKTFTASFTTQGDGTCTGGYWDGFVSGGRRFLTRSWYEVTTYSGRVTEFVGTRRLAEGGAATAAVGGNVTAEYAAGFAHDDGGEGSFVWDATEECDDWVEQVYDGNAKVAKRTERGDSYRDAITIFKRKEKEEEGSGETRTAAVVALRLKTPVAVCGRTCYKTQVKGMLVCPPEAKGLREFHFKGNLSETEVSQAVQPSHHSIGSYQSTMKVMADVSRQVCEGDVKARQLLLDAVKSGDKAELITALGRGYRVSERGGNVAYITRCSPRQANLRRFPNCTRNIPVEVSVPGRDERIPAFADPFTGVVTHTPEILPCDPVHPEHWRILGKWYRSLPALGLIWGSPTFDRHTSDGGDGEGLALDLLDFEPLCRHCSEEDRRVHALVEMEKAARASLAAEQMRRAVGNGHLDRQSGVFVFGSPMKEEEEEALTRRIEERVKGEALKWAVIGFFICVLAIIALWVIYQLIETARKKGWSVRRLVLAFTDFFRSPGGSDAEQGHNGQTQAGGGGDGGSFSAVSFEGESARIRRDPPGNR